MVFQIRFACMSVMVSLTRAMHNGPPTIWESATSLSLCGQASLSFPSLFCQYIFSLALIMPSRWAGSISGSHNFPWWPYVQLKDDFKLRVLKAWRVETRTTDPKFSFSLFHSFSVGVNQDLFFWSQGFTSLKSRNKWTCLICQGGTT